MSEPRTVVAIGIDPIEQETILELQFIYLDQRATAQHAFVGQAFEVIESVGDSVTWVGEIATIGFAQRGKIPETVVTVRPGYLWVEQKRYTREKKVIIAPNPPRDRRN